MREISTDKSDEDNVELKRCKDPTYSTSEIYELRISLFDHDKQEECLLFVCNFNMTLVARGMQVMYVNVRYLCTIVCGVALRNFDLFSVDVENIDTPLNFDDLFKGLSWYLPHVNSLFKKRAMS